MGISISSFEVWLPKGAVVTDALVESRVIEINGNGIGSVEEFKGIDCGCYCDSYHQPLKEVPRNQRREGILLARI